MQNITRMLCNFAKYVFHAILQDRCSFIQQYCKAEDNLHLKVSVRLKRLYKRSRLVGSVSLCTIYRHLYLVFCFSRATFIRKMFSRLTCRDFDTASLSYKNTKTRRSSLRGILQRRHAKFKCSL